MQYQLQNIDRGAVIGESINHVRRLVNEPPAMIYPESFAQRASQLATDVGLSVEVWDEQNLAAEALPGAASGRSGVGETATIGDLASRRRR